MCCGDGGDLEATTEACPMLDRLSSCSRCRRWALRLEEPRQVVTV